MISVYSPDMRDHYPERKSVQWVHFITEPRRDKEQVNAEIFGTFFHRLLARSCAKGVIQWMRSSSRTVGLRFRCDLPEEKRFLLLKSEMNPGEH
jgi:hypothetical protein